jgi:endonuclease/exonuclease/phosphatase family metal-dependent hydrolase
MFQNRSVTAGLLLALVLGLIAWAMARANDATGQRPLRVATWNLQWLVEPDTARIARIACRDGVAAPLPCDVARTLARDSADRSRLAALVRRLDADVIAFQEVQSAQVARRVFRGYSICIARGAGVQHTGFAVRAGLEHRCGEPLLSIAAGDRGRAGQPLTLLPPGQPPIELLAVHLKSGCSTDPLHSSSAACVLLSRQAQALGEWIEARARAGAGFMVLGDLNRAGLPAADDAFWSLLHPHRFEAAASHLPFRNCVFGAPYTAFIDHILVSQTLLPRLNSPAFEQLRFEPHEATQYRLSDHCPVSVMLSTTHSL